MNIRYELMKQSSDRDASPNHLITVKPSQFESRLIINALKFAGFPDHVSIDYVEFKGKNMKIWYIVIETSKRDCEQSLKKRG